MGTKEIKEKLLSTSMFIDNKYLDKYCELMYNNLGTIQEKFKTQKHHMIPIVCYKVKYDCNNRQEAEVFSKEDSNEIINLTYSDHV